MTDPKIAPLFDVGAIRGRVENIADRISKMGQGPYLAEIVLNGAVIFGADLARALSVRGVELEIDFIALSSYGRGKKSSGDVKLAAEARGAIEGRDVLIIDDILETGKTLLYAKNYFMDRGASRVMTAVLLDKSLGRDVAIKPDFTGFTCPDVFVVGYGMDHAYRYRELPYIGQMPDIDESTGENE